MGVAYHCGSAQRRSIVKEAADWNGIDFLEVSQPTHLILRFVKPEPLPDVNGAWVLIEGAEGTLPVRVKTATMSAQGCQIALIATGDTSAYTLRLRNPISGSLPDKLDPRLAEVTFRFQTEAPVDAGDASSFLPDPEFSYLAKDYASFRRLMLDRLALLLPQGVEDQPADLQVALVELLAYTADRLSYYQDAVGTEAYLGTARSRISLRRHARLLGYRMHEGCNARAWVFCQVKEPCQVGKEWRFSTEGPQTGAVVFEPCHRPQLAPGLNAVPIYTWGERDFSLPRGATSAALQSAPLPLAAGDLLLFEREPAEVRPSSCHVVRLLSAKAGKDPVNQEPIVELRWGAEDALSFDFPIRVQNQTVAVARGNLVLVDQGRTLSDAPVRTAQRIRLRETPLTYAEPLPADLTSSSLASLTSAVGLLRRDVRAALPRVECTEHDETRWQARHDLLASRGSDTVFVVETEHDGTASLRFGDGSYGRSPTPNTAWKASYRVGGGQAGNVGAATICKLASSDAEDAIKVVAVRNPLPAEGGQDPELADQVRLFAPQAFRSQQRCINADDYAARAQSFPGVQRASALIRWTGSWYTVFLFIDRLGGRRVDDDFKQGVLRHLEGQRLAGYDIEIRGSSDVALDIHLLVHVKAGFLPSAVEAELTEILGNRELSAGRRGYLHPDNWTFGQAVYLSQLYKVVLSVSGVASVDIDTFQRLGASGSVARDQGVIAMAAHEIVQSNHPVRIDLGRRLSA